MNWGKGHECSDPGINVLGDIEGSLESLLVVGPLVFGSDHTEANATLYMIKL